MRFIDPHFIPLMEQRGFASFEDIWAGRGDPVERPNNTPQGESRVCRESWLNPATGAEEIFFVKYQDNYCFRGLRHPLRGAPPARQEFKILLKLKALGFPAPVPVYYEESKIGGRLRVILITRELKGRSLREHLIAAPFNQALAAQLAELVYRFNRQLGFVHCALRTKHVWVGEQGLALIDLEHALPRWQSFRSRFDDLKVLLRSVRNSAGLSEFQALRILGAYARLARRHSPLDRLLLRLGITCMLPPVDGRKGARYAGDPRGRSERRRREKLEG